MKVVSSQKIQKYNSTPTGSFVWAESHEHGDHFNWGPEQPNGNTVENCVWKSGGSGLWYDAECSWTSYNGVQEHALCEH